MATGLHKNTVQEAVAPYSKAVAGDVAAMEESKGIYVKVAGNHSLTIGGTAVTFTGLLAGKFYPFAVTAAPSDVLLLY